MKLHDSGLFDVVHLNIYGRIAAVEPNDPYYTQGYHWNLNKIKMPDAWEKSKGSSSIKVAIIDVGVQHDHPDLIKNRWSGIGYDFYDMDSDPRPENIEQYKNSHGTAVTGIICANLNNALGVSGIAGGWGTQRGITFMSLRAGKYIAPNFDIMDIAACTDAIDYAAYNGADVISCSWNTTSAVPELEMAIDAAVTSHNVVIVFSSGNYTDKVTPETKKVQFTANLYYTIAVGASTESDKRKYKNDGTDEPGWGSCYGSELDVVAPGIHISTTDYSGQYGYSTNDYYSLFNGTSSAAPHVAALSALILSINPDLYWYEVRDIIRNNADKVGGYQYTNGFNEEMGYGRINAKRTLNATPVPLTVTISGPYYLPEDEDGTFTANPSGGSGTYINYQWWYRNDEGSVPPKAVKGGVTPMAPPPGYWIYLSYYEGEKTINFGPSFDFSLKCKVTDSDGNTATDIHSVIVGGPAKDIAKKIPINVIESIPEQLTLIGNYPNPFNPTTSIKFGLPDAMLVEISIYSITGKKVITLINQDLSAGYYQVTWDGTDKSGNKISSGIYIYILKAGSKRLTSKMLFAK